MATNAHVNLLLLNELLSSSSDDDSEDEEIHALLLNRQEIPKIRNFIIDVVEKLTDKQFKENFRMTRDTAYELIDTFQQSEFYPNDRTCGGSSPMSATNHILSFLWFAGNKSCLRDVSQRFGIGISTLFRQINRVLDFLNNIAPNVIKFLVTEAEKDSIALGFYKISHFPGVLGCIDGTSINLRTPAHKVKSTYTNRHDLPSITLQGICDHNKRFIDVFTGAPGKIHDARVLKLSDINDTLPLCGKAHHILGDGAYSIRTWLLRPYKDYGTLRPDEVKYNKIFCSVRVCIENAFGILKGRFRQLMRLDIHTVDKITKFIIACCVLHNMCIDKEDFIDDRDMVVCNDPDDDEIVVEASLQTEMQLRKQGEQKRNVLKNTFALS